MTEPVPEPEVTVQDVVLALEHALALLKRLELPTEDQTEFQKSAWVLAWMNRRVP